MADISKSSRIPAWPFWVGDGLLLFWAASVWLSSDRDLNFASVSFYILSITVALLLGVAPLFLDWWFTRQEQRRAQDRDFQGKVALALGELLDRVAAPVAESSPSKVSGPSFDEEKFEQSLQQWGDRIAKELEGVARGQGEALEARLNSLKAELVAKKPLEGEILGHLEAIKLLLQSRLDSEGESAGASDKKGSRRGVSGILYPKHTKASWVETVEEPPREKGKLKERASPVVLEQEEDSSSDDNISPEDDLAVSEEESPAPEAGADETLTKEEPVSKSKGKPDDESEAKLGGEVEVRVHALIGIGNKPFVRGNLPGLSMEKGEPLEFLEIGKWSWKGSLPEEGEGTVEIWLNDEIPARENPVAVSEQSLVEIRPQFS